MFFLKVIRIVVRKKKTNIKPVELENNNKRRKEVNKDTLFYAESERLKQLHFSLLSTNWTSLYRESRKRNA